MVEKISAEQAYMNHVMRQLPQVERGNVYKIKANDSLWNIAKQNVTTKNPQASKAEIQNYMYQIAKLNNITTIEQMNKLKVTEEIYLPKNVQSSAAKATTVATKPNTVQKTKTVTRPAAANHQHPRTSAETSILELINKIKNDKTVVVEKMYKGYYSTNDLYTIYCAYNDPNSGYQTMRRPLMNVTKDKSSGSITLITFNDQKADIYPTKFDYQIDAQGNIQTNNILRPTSQGRMNRNELNELHNLLNNRISGSVPYSH